MFLKNGNFFAGVYQWSIINGQKKGEPLLPNSNKRKNNLIT